MNEDFAKFAPESILIHNHPENKTFSNYDLRLFNESYNVKVLVDAGQKVYALDKNGAGTIDADMIREYNKAYELLGDYDRVVAELCKIYHWRYYKL